ncbi:MAG: type II toxin-antitoxin system HicB family antitoxin [Chitinophagia bacterium]
MSSLFKYGEYMGSVKYSDEDEIFYGTVLGIDDLVTFEGSSVRELKKAFKDSVNDYVNLCMKQGRSPKKTYKGTFNVRIPVDLHKKAAVIAEDKGISLNELVKQGLERMLSFRVS